MPAVHILARRVSGIPHRDPHHLSPRCHKGSDGPLVQSQNPIDHLLLGFLENTQCSALFNEDLDLFRGDVGFQGGFDPEYPEHQIRRHAKEAHKRSGEQRQKTHGWRHGGGDSLRVDQGDSLGSEPQHKRENGFTTTTWRPMIPRRRSEDTRRKTLISWARVAPESPCQDSTADPICTVARNR
jgi:hypothetical protein